MYIYIYIYICTYVYRYVCMHIYIYACIYDASYTCVEAQALFNRTAFINDTFQGQMLSHQYAHPDAYSYVYIYTHTLTQIHVCICTYSYTQNVQTFTQICGISHNTHTTQVLFNRAAIINDTFQDQMQSIVESLNATKRRGSQIGVSTGVCVGLGSPLPQRSDGAEKEEEGEGIVLRRGPVKLPERAMQKCVRSYRRDAGCLADLVRCTLIAKTPQLVMCVCDGSLMCVA